METAFACPGKQRSAFHWRGTGFPVREESDAERERWQAAHPEEILRQKGDKRLLVMDEEFASSLACTRCEALISTF